MAAVFEPIGKAVQENGRYFVQFDSQYMNATLGLDAFSHIQVVWWFHLTDSQETRTYYVMDAPYTNGPEKIGVFATRGPIRPNPIAMSACTLIQVDREKNRLEVAYLDAEDGTPILDIKPYHPSSDTIRDVHMPAWCAHWPSCYEESGTFDWSSVFNFPS
ncbi:MAG TPA: SAM-dependent methyltransferase [Candidatus Limiplasma sp.]|nr:SAM-dependent methyltransferase [Candidatus Limiplasma sp.]HRX07904.1 SAM-dependent methyltransferase [Candidatus Limiplasma sp.]